MQTPLARPAGSLPPPTKRSTTCWPGARPVPSLPEASQARWRVQRQDVIGRCPRNDVRGAAHLPESSAIQNPHREWGMAITPERPVPAKPVFDEFGAAQGRGQIRAPAKLPGMVIGPSPEYRVQPLYFQRSRGDEPLRAPERVQVRNERDMPVPAACRQPLLCPPSVRRSETAIHAGKCPGPSCREAVHRESACIPGGISRNSSFRSGSAVRGPGGRQSRTISRSGRARRASSPVAEPPASFPQATTPISNPFPEPHVRPARMSPFQSRRSASALTARYAFRCLVRDMLERWRRQSSSGGLNPADPLPPA